MLVSQIQEPTFFQFYVMKMRKRHPVKSRHRGVSGYEPTALLAPTIQQDR